MPGTFVAWKSRHVKRNNEAFGTRGNPVGNGTFEYGQARHECGTKICREQRIGYARRLLGRTNITTTQRYVHLDEGELADAQDRVE
jgi:hypothetical protein